ncbi:MULTISPECIES: hypothetical protein [Streptomyces]|uniref:hypothetical protein n=1 Tax=Streptomyces TaxID=1883 RepID=UPI0023DD17AE|nr:hypothetical protein [Streptomyces sp. FXJ1.172]WEP00682.1 hypothetical protein A6P39_044015 [Streptomyces sp. FXJ1.172]
MTRAGRYHLLLATGGRPVQHGWWHEEKTGRRNFDTWAREYSSMPDPQVTLTDEETSETLAEWPEAD